MAKETATRKPRKVNSNEVKILKELKTMNKTLKDIKTIQDNMWRERLPS